MKKLLILAVLLLTHSLCTAGELPAGWNRYVDNKKNTITFKPKDTNIDIMVKYYPIELLDRVNVDQWLRNKVSNSVAPRGEWVDGIKEFTRASFNQSYCTRQFRENNGTTGWFAANAYSADRLFVRLGIMIVGGDVNRSYIDQAGEIYRDLSNVEIANAKDELRGLDLETGAYKVANVKKGGPIKPGRYVGQKIVSGKVQGTYSLILYDTGEYEFLNTQKEYYGYYVYSAYFAKLYIEDPCTNAVVTNENEFCVYGTNTKTGKPVIYAYRNSAEYRLNWAGEVDRLPPSQRTKLAEMDAAKKTDQGYQYITNPGDGLSLDEIETILYVYEESDVPGNSAISQEIYLLTKSGRVMDNLPVAPNTLVAWKSQNKEPDRWGWWKYDGDRYSFSWDVDKTHYTVPKGKQKKTKPIPKGTHLKGEWISVINHSSANLSSTTYWGARLDKEGRFVNLYEKLIKVNGKAFGKKKGSAPQAAANEMGRYEFDGYSLTLKYDSGEEWHFPTFTLDDEFQSIWYRGSLINHK
jgi:hypothetical protein